MIDRKTPNIGRKLRNHDTTPIPYTKLKTKISSTKPFKSAQECFSTLINFHEINIH